MKLIPDRYPGWNQHPVYTISQYTQSEVDEFFKRCYQLHIETFALSFGNGRQTFQVKTNHALFVLQWI
jgi:hypothetical protein